MILKHVGGQDLTCRVPTPDLCQTLLHGGTAVSMASVIPAGRRSRVDIRGGVVYAVHSLARERLGQWWTIRATQI